MENNMSAKGGSASGGKKILVASLIIVVGIAVIFIFRRKDTGAPESFTPSENGSSLKVGTNIGNIAPDFEARTYDGETVRLSDYRGNPVFVNFWAAWCPFCVDELPLMAGVQNKYGDSYITLAINRGESLETAKKFSDELNVTGMMIFLLNEKDDIYQRYGGFAMPYSLFLDEDGVIVDVKRGPLTPKELEGKINKIIQ